MFLCQFRCSRCSKPFIRPLFPVCQSQYRYKSTRNHYDVLGVPYNASQDQIKDAYIQLTKKYHPDKNANKGSQEKFVEIRNAYTVLSRSSSRKDYDIQIKYSRQPHYYDTFRDSADPYDQPTGFYSRRNDPRDTPYWKQDPFREDYGYQYEQRKRMRDWAEEMARERERNKEPIDRQYTEKTLKLLVLLIALLYFAAYTEHPERFKKKSVKDREHIEFLDRRSLKRQAELMEASRNNRDYIAEDNER